MTQKIILHHILFTGKDLEPAGLDFGGKQSFIYGASNTGKSFALKAINYMLGGKPKDLPNIDERIGYDTALLGLTLPQDGDVVLSRATNGGAFALNNGLNIPSDTSPKTKILGATHDDDDSENLSRYLLDRLGFGSKRLAKNSAGQTIGLSFRHLIRYCLVDETSIQAPQTPIAGLRPDEQLDRSIFRMLLTGQDDSALKARLTAPQFRVSKQTRLATMDDLISDIDKEIADTQTALDALPNSVSVEEEFEAIRRDLDAGRESVRDFVERRSQIVTSLADNTSRQNDVRAHLGRFYELEKLYTSDIERLEAIEEAGFLLNLGGDRECPLCGASPENQSSSHGTQQIEDLRTAAVAEIEKIQALRDGLRPTIDDLASELTQLSISGERLNLELESIEVNITRLSDQLNSREGQVRGTLEQRDLVLKLVQLREQRIVFINRRNEYNKQRQSRKEKAALTIPDKPLYDLSQVISEILTSWQFPGERHVAFDPQTNDFRIDGKLRTDNGKGVRALTHAAFKLGVMLYCHERALPHPGFIILDSPLLTYRDAVKNPKHGTLSADERALAQTPVREKFFEHLAALSDVGQIIIFDNIDPPAAAFEFAEPVLFSGSSEERYGFFPVGS